MYLITTIPEPPFAPIPVEYLVPPPPPPPVFIVPPTPITPGLLFAPAPPPPIASELAAPIPPAPQPPIQSTGRGRGRPPGSKNKPKTQPTQEDADDPKTEGRRLLKILKNVLGKTNFTATILDDIGSIEELDILIESVYTDEDDETKDNIRAFWNTRKQLGKTPKE